MKFTFIQWSSIAWIWWDMIIWKNVWKAKEGWINKFISIVKVRPYLYLQSKVLCTYSLVQSNLAIRNFLNALKLFLNAKSSLFLWSKWQIGHGKWFLNTNLFLIKPFLISKFDCMYYALSKYVNTLFLVGYLKILPLCCDKHVAAVGNGGDD